MVFKEHQEESPGHRVLEAYYAILIWVTVLRKPVLKVEAEQDCHKEIHKKNPVAACTRELFKKLLVNPRKHCHKKRIPLQLVPGSYLRNCW